MTKRQRRMMSIILVFAWAFTITFAVVGMVLILWSVDFEVGTYALASGGLFGMIAHLLGDKRIQVSLFDE